MPHCSTVLSQIVRIFPRHEFQSLANKHHAGQKFRSFTRWTQFVAMLTAQLSGRCSLRDVVDNLAVQGQKIYHLGIKAFSRATLARCNENQPHTLYEELFQRLLGRCQSMAPRTRKFKLNGKIYLLDASLLDLTLSLFPWAKYQKTKGAAKLHVGLDADGYLERWQIELFFKWIKQNLKVKSFLGTSMNAVKTQLWIALCAYLVLSFLKFQSKIGASLQRMLRILQLNLFERRDLTELFNPPTPENGLQNGQLCLL